MTIKEFKQILEHGLKINNIEIDLSNEKINLLYMYMKFLLEKNKHINLTAIRDEKEFIYKHYIDSLFLVQSIKSNESSKQSEDTKKHNKIKLIDIGTGGGFPGMPLLIAIDDLEVTFLDSTSKKLKVIEEFTTENNLLNAIFIHERAEVLNKDKNHINKYSYAVTRAVSSVENVIQYTKPYLTKDGTGIAMRGQLEHQEKESLKTNKHIKEVKTYQLIMETDKHKDTTKNKNKDSHIKKDINERSILFIQ